MKLKSVLMMTAALSFGAVSAQQTAGTTAVQAPTLTDVPAGHWARDAVERLVAQGIILGYPDGTFRGAQNITRYEAALIISRLLDLIAQGTVTITDSETNVSVQNAIQELAADLAALGVRVADLEENAASREDIARLEARIDQLAAGMVPGEAGTGDMDATMASDIAVIAGNLESMSELIIVLSDDVRDLSARVSALEAAADAAPAEAGEATETGTEIDAELVTRLETVLVNYDEVVGRIDAIDESIAALNDLSVLLNEDILSLQDRVAAIEGDLVTRAEFNAVRTTVNELAARPQVTFGIGATGSSFRSTSFVGNAEFDIDRLTLGTFANGRHRSAGTAVSVANVDFRPGDARTGASNTIGAFTIGVRNLVNTGAIRITEASVGLGVNFNVLASPAVGNFTPDRNVAGVVFNSLNVRGAIAEQPFTASYAFGPQNIRFNDLFFVNDLDVGVANSIIARIEGTTLPLNPALTIVAGADRRSTSVLGDVFAIRAAIRPLPNAALGLNYATWADRSGFSADANVNIGPVNVFGIFATSSTDNDGIFAFDARAAFARAQYGRAGDPLRIGAYVVDTNTNWNRTTAASNAFGEDGGAIITGAINRFGVAAQANISLLTVGAYYDSLAPYTRPEGATADVLGTRVESFGVHAGVNLLSSLRLIGFYNQSSSLTLDAETTASGTAPYIGIPAPYRRGNNFGVVLSHVGTTSATNTPIIPGLNFDLGYAVFTQINNASDVSFSADYALGLGFATVTPFVRYHTYSGGSQGTAVFPGHTTFKGGASVNTAAGVLPFGLTLNGGFATRNTTYTDTGSDTNEQFYRVGLQAANLLGAGTSFGVGYSAYSASGVTSVAVGNRNAPFLRTEDSIFSNNTSLAYRTPAARNANGFVNGLYAQFNYQGILFDYGLFNYGGAGHTEAARNGSSTVQNFRVSYSFNF